MSYVVTRIAKQNPDINGRKLYLTKFGLWSLNPEHARHFDTVERARQWPGDNLSVEAVQ